jgi:hypothetical protein
LWALDIFRAGGRVVQEVKMTSTVTKAADLLTDSTFLALCASWQRDRRAPLCLPDFLREWGLDRQAETAEWAVQAPDRLYYVTMGEIDGTLPPNTHCGICPEFNTRTQKWGWYYSLSRCYESNDLKLRPNDDWRRRGWRLLPTFALAIVELLDNYEPPQE